MPVLVTGTAGFIGNEIALRLLDRGEAVVGVDCLTPYYDLSLKEARLARLAERPRFVESRVDLADRDASVELFATHRPECIVHMAAQPGVRYSIEHPHAYVDCNVTAFLNVLEGCRAVEAKHLVYASSSSVYGGNERMPFSVHHPADHPVSLYAATKRANELMAHTYAHLYGIPATGLRFFTVYGPWGRPDMAPVLFAKAISNGRPIDIYNDGEMRRDFTYIDDIVEGVLRVLAVIPAPSDDPAAAEDPAVSPVAPHRVYNIGNGRAVDLMRFIALLEEALGRTAEKNMMPMQPGDVKETWADTADLEAATGWKPGIGIEEGVGRFVAWYREYYGAGGE
ncbi:MAG: NAD-dependent epimerase [Rhodospirillales bacterium]|nr:MAG: NAD-dependent epimerase [Rhodospirillales bacterium]